MGMMDGLVLSVVGSVIEAGSRYGHEGGLGARAAGSDQDRMPRQGLTECVCANQAHDLEVSRYEDEEVESLPEMTVTAIADARVLYLQRVAPFNALSDGAKNRLFFVDASST
jgi:hypothetical protein